MNALETPRPQFSQSFPTRRSKQVSRPRRSPASRPQGAVQSSQVGAIALEASLKLGVNVVLSLAAFTALSQLLPYHFSQQTKLRELEMEVQRSQKRTSMQQMNFNRYFNVQSAKSLMQEQSYRVDPNQRQVVLTDGKVPDEESLTHP